MDGILLVIVDLRLEAKSLLTKVSSSSIFFVVVGSGILAEGLGLSKRSLLVKRLATMGVTLVRYDPVISTQSDGW